MEGVPVDYVIERQNTILPAQENSQLPKKQQLSLKAVVNAVQQHQQNSNTQTATSGQLQRVNSSSQSIQSSSQQQPSQQQQQGGPLTDQHSNLAVQPNQQNLMQQQQDHPGQNRQQNFPGHSPPNFPPQISPPQNTQYTANQPPQPPQNQTQAQVLHQIPPQPLYKQQPPSAQQTVLIPPQPQLNQQHVVIQHQLMPPQQLQQPSYQQQLQQPMALIQTPVLYSNAPAANSPVKAIKKGRFRVVKGGVKETKVSDNQFVTSSEAQSGADTAPQPVSTVKKGRFVVKKAAVAVTKAGNNSSPKNNESEKVASNATHENDAANAGRDIAGDKSKTAIQTGKVNENKGDTKPDAPPVTMKQATAKNPCTTKKKGRFLVKTGGGGAARSAVSPASTPNLPAIETKSSLHVAAAGANAVSTGTGVPPKADKGIISGAEAEETRGKAGDVSLDKPPAKGNSTMPSKVVLDSVAATQGIKKKGRFVVKTGAVAKFPAGTNNVPPSGQEGKQTTGIGSGLIVQPIAPQNLQMNPHIEVTSDAGVGNMHIVQLTPPQNPHISNCIAGNVPIPIGMPMASLVDVNGQMMVANLAMQQPLQQITVTQPFATPPIRNPTVSVRSQTQPQPQPSPCDAQSLPSQIPPSPRSQMVVDQRPLENSSFTAKTQFQRPNRPVGSSSSNWPASRAACSPGKKERLIGAGGLGKALHYLDTFRSEVLEADLSMASLQSDHRFLRDKNKELETKISNLERQLVEEKGLRQGAEQKYESLRQQVREQEMDANHPQSESGMHRVELEPNPSADGGIVSLDGRSLKPNETLENESGRVSSNPSLNNQLANDSATDIKLENRRSVSFEDLQLTEANATIQQKEPKNKIAAVNGPVPVSQVKLPTMGPRVLAGPNSKLHIPKKTEIGKNISSDAPGEKQTPYMSQSVTGLSIAQQFDPLGNGPASSAFHCIPTMANILNENVAIPLVVTTSQPTPPPIHPVDMQCTPVANTKKNHFDPLGTPEESEMSAVSALVLNGMQQMPAMANVNGSMALPVIVPIIHQQNQQEDPFDEIVRMSQSQG